MLQYSSFSPTSLLFGSVSKYHPHKHQHEHQHQRQHKTWSQHLTPRNKRKMETKALYAEEIHAEFIKAVANYKKKKDDFVKNEIHEIADTLNNINLFTDKMEIDNEEMEPMAIDEEEEADVEMSEMEYHFPKRSRLTFYR